MRMALLFTDEVPEVCYGIFRVSNQLRFGLRAMIFFALDV